MATSPPPWRQVLNLRRHEWPLALLMFGQFFLVITIFWIVKPLKKFLFLQHYQAMPLHLWNWQLGGAQAEQLAKVLNMFSAVGAMVLFGALSTRLRRARLMMTLCLLFALAFALFAFGMQRPGNAGVWSFYLFGDLWSTMMVAAFFAFLNDSVAPESSKRLYGLIGVGGVLGGAIGTTVLATWIATFSRAQWLGACAGLCTLIAGLAWAAELRSRQSTEPEARPEGGHQAGPRRAAFAGASLVWRSPYLRSIAAIVGIYQMVSTIMDFQFSQGLELLLQGDALAAHGARVFAITNWLALGVQLLATSFVMQRFGVGVALLVLPAVASLGSVAFLAWPGLWTASALNTADNAFAYSIQQSAKEALYVPTRRAEKYQAKAFIDMVVERSAKALGVGLNLLMLQSVHAFAGLRWLSVASLTLLTLWILAVRTAGRGYAGLSRPVHPPPPERQSFVPAPRLPMMPPACWSMLRPMPRMRGRKYCMCAICTCIRARGVRAWHSKTLRMTTSRSHTGSPAASSRLRVCDGLNSASTTKRSAPAASASLPMRAAKPERSSVLGSGRCSR